jgi:hypothetical protein
MWKRLVILSHLTSDLQDSTSYANTWPLMGAIDGVVNDGNDLKSGSYKCVGPFT